MSESSCNVLFPRFLRELEEGFNLLFYGFGSKRDFMNKFAVECSRAGHVVVVNGFKRDSSIKDMLNAIENIPVVLSVPILSTAAESQARRIYDFFASPSQAEHLYIVIHNIDSSAFRATKAKSCLSLLALNPRIHLIASVDLINAPLLWSSTELSSHKQGFEAQDSVPPRGFAWLWHDITTLLPYDVELSYADRSSISGAHGGSIPRRETGILPGQSGTLVTETAALHVLASVTQKAKKLFAWMGTKQIERIEEAKDAIMADLQQFGIGYDLLFNAARDNFIATNDTALRSLLGEFRDHGLVLAAPGSSGIGEVLWIPVRKERLSKILRSIQID
jgi:origin recognition complex subunit 2